MNARALLALVAVGGVGVLGFALVRSRPPAMMAYTPAQTAPAQPKSGAQVVGAQTGPLLTVGVASGYAPVSYKDTGAVDGSYNPPGWDYVPLGVIGGGR